MNGALTLGLSIRGVLALVFVYCLVASGHERLLVLGRCALLLGLIHLCLIRQLGCFLCGTLVSPFAYEIPARLGRNPNRLLVDGVHALGLSIRGVLICDFVRPEGVLGFGSRLHLRN